MSIFICLLAILFVGAFGSIDWLTHRSMVKDFTNQYGWSDYKTFVEEFHKVEWEYQTSIFNFSDSLFSKNHTDQFHANIIQFNGKGMIINNPISYFFVKLYVKKYIKKTYGFSSKVKEWR